MATSVGAREGHSSGWGGRVVGGGEQAPEGSNGHLSGSQGGSQQWMGWASSWGWVSSRSHCTLTFFKFDDFLMSVFERFQIALLHQKGRREEQASKISIDGGWREETRECDTGNHIQWEKHHRL